ncbi:MAG: FlgD immunoglobulin-like domain containing protein [Calditrichia bacterium]
MKTITFLAIAIFFILSASDISYSQAPGYVLNLQADSDVYSDGAGLSPALNGENVQLWKDQSGNGLNATPGTAPVFMNNAGSTINGKPVLRFDKTNSERLDLADDPLLNTGGPYPQKTLIMVFKTGAIISDTSVVIEFGAARNGLNIHIRNDSLYAGVWRRSSGLWIGDVISANTPYMITLIYDGNTNPTSDRLKVYVNRVLIGSGDPGFSSIPSHSGDIGIGEIDGRTRISNGGSGNLRARNTPYGFSGDIAEIFVYNSALTSEEQTQTEDFLKTKYGTQDNPLPVSLAFFNASTLDGRVELSWATESEVNNEAFIIERAVDGHPFEKIGEIQGHGNSTSRIDYTFTDNTVINGTAYTYRLSDRDFNGNITNLQTLTVVPNITGTDLIQRESIATRLYLYPNFPNPFNPSTRIKFEVPGTDGQVQQVKLFIYNALGQPVRKLVNGPMSKGVYELEWDGTNDSGVRQPAGVFFLNLKTNLRSKTIKMYLVR